MVVLVGLEAGWRAWRRSPPGGVADRLQGLLLLVLVVTIAGGLGLLIGGARPRELLHFVYAIVALGALPVAGSLSRNWGSSQRGVASLAAAIVALTVIVRLFETG